MSETIHTPESTSSIIEAGSLAQYLEEIGRHTIPKREEEASLAKQRAAMVAAREMLSNELQLSHLGPEKINKLHEIETIGHKAEKRLREGNLRLVVSIAKRYKGTNGGPELLELCGDGNVGLIKAVEKYDHTKGYKFSTYGTWWIRQAIVKRLGDHSNMMVRIPAAAFQARKKIDRTISDQWPAESFAHTEENIQRLLEVTGLSRSVIEDSLASRYWFGVRSSINSTLGANSTDGTIEDYLEDTTIAQPEDEAMSNVERDYVHSMLSKLSDKERDIIQRRFGIGTDVPEALQSIGDSYGVTRERIRQIENAALKKLKTLYRCDPGNF